MARKVYPVPEAIRGEAWQIDVGAPRCNPKGRIMFVPLSDDPHLACIRAHETAHAVWTPENARLPASIPAIVLNAVEDARVNKLCLDAGVSFDAGVPPEVCAGALAMARGDWRRLCVYLVASLDDPDYARMIDGARAIKDGWDVDELDHADAVAREARQMLEARLPKKSGAPLTYPRTLHVAHWLAEQLGGESRGRKGGNPDAPVSSTGGAAPWGKLVLDAPRLDVRATARLAPTSEGTILREPWRVTTDSAVFRHKKVPKRGSVLCDASGSMALDAADIARLARVVPAGIVGAYGSSARQGTVRVLARRGMITTAPASYVFGGGNVIDGPALRWLASQPMPRVWISDGHVTGIDDHFYRECTDDAARVCREAGIIRVARIDDAIKRFRR